MATPAASQDYLIYWLDEAVPIGEPVLAADEQGRLGRISHPRRHRRFIRGRALLQHALTENFGKPLAYGTHSSGAIDCKIPGYAAGLSHGGTVTALALAPGEHLGLDIEAPKPRDYLAVAKAHFHPAEQRELQALSPEEALQRFYQLWTLKEAQAKLRRTSIYAGPLPQNTLAALSRPQAPAHHSTHHQGYAVALLLSDADPNALPLRPTFIQPTTLPAAESVPPPPHAPRRWQP